MNSLFENKHNDHAIASYYNGKYYLACNLEMDEDIVGCEDSDYTNNILLELDVKTGEINILRGYDIINVQALNTKIESKLIVCIKDNNKYRLGEVKKCGTVFGNSTTKVWKSPKTSFDHSMNFKLLKSINISADCDMDICIRTEDFIRKYSIKKSDKIITISPNLKAKEFAIDFVSKDRKVYISNPQVEVVIL